VISNLVKRRREKRPSPPCSGSTPPLSSGAGRRVVPGTPLQSRSAPSMRFRSWGSSMPSTIRSAPWNGWRGGGRHEPLLFRLLARSGSWGCPVGNRTRGNFSHLLLRAMERQREAAMNLRCLLGWHDFGSDGDYEYIGDGRWRPTVTCGNCGARPRKAR
jgi:hypothetical protein